MVGNAAVISLTGVVIRDRDECANVGKLNKMPQYISSVPEAMAVFFHVMGSVKESLRRILIQGDYDDNSDDSMHARARLADMLNSTSNKLQSLGIQDNSTDFLMEEVRVLSESKGIGLPDFLSLSAFMTILQSKIKAISEIPVDFMTEAWDYIETAVVFVLKSHCHHYPHLMSSNRRATGGLIARMKDECTKRVEEIVEMEKLTDYTCNPEYMSVYNRLMMCQDQFMKSVNNVSRREVAVITIEGFGMVDVSEMREHKHVAQQAFDLRARIVSYMKIVLNRLVDSMALHLMFSIKNLVNKELEIEIVNELMGPSGDGIKKLLDESPSVADKREKLNKSIRLLSESKEVVSKILDSVAVNE